MKTAIQFAAGALAALVGILVIQTHPVAAVLAFAAAAAIFATAAWKERE